MNRYQKQPNSLNLSHAHHHVNIIHRTQLYVTRTTKTVSTWFARSAGKQWCTHLIVLTVKLRYVTLGNHTRRPKVSNKKWVRKAWKYTRLATLLAFTSLVLSVILGAWAIYIKMAGGGI